MSIAQYGRFILEDDNSVAQQTWLISEFSLCRLEDTSSASVLPSSVLQVSLPSLGSSSQQACRCRVLLTLFQNLFVSLSHSFYNTVHLIHAVHGMLSSAPSLCCSSRRSCEQTQAREKQNRLLDTRLLANQLWLFTVFQRAGEELLETPSQYRNERRKQPLLRIVVDVLPSQRRGDRARHVEK